MNLPPKALTILIDLKKELLDREPNEHPTDAVDTPARIEFARSTPERTMRRAVIRGSGYQGYRRQELDT